MIKKCKGIMPEICEGTYISESAVICGDVKIENECSVWFNVSIRGDMSSIKICKRTNIQDNAVLHNSLGHDLTIGEGVTIGHSAVIHNKRIGSNSLIGMGAILLDDSEVGENCIIGAGSLVTENTIIPDGQLWFGNPAKYRRDLTEEEIMNIKENALHYYELMQSYREEE